MCCSCWIPIYSCWFWINAMLFWLYISRPWPSFIILLTHWGRVTHICVGKLTIIGSDNGLSPGRRQAIIWTNAGILLIGPLGTNFSEILIEILTFSFKKMRLKVSSAKWRLFCLGLNVLNKLIDVAERPLDHMLVGWLVALIQYIAKFAHTDQHWSTHGKLWSIMATVNECDIQHG